MTKLMFVCSGNTCRSAMAEYIMRNLLKLNKMKGVVVASSGLDVTESAINEQAKASLLKLKIRTRKFVPKQVTAEIVLEQDAVICMTEQQKSRFVSFDNVYSFSELTKLGDVPDPYGKSQEIYDETAQVLLDGCKIILQLINNKGE